MKLRDIVEHQIHRSEYKPALKKPTPGNTPDLPPYLDSSKYKDKLREKKRKKEKARKERDRRKRIEREAAAEPDRARLMPDPVG
jgi:hypothetical protein